MNRARDKRKALKFDVINGSYYGTHGLYNPFTRSKAL